MPRSNNIRGTKKPLSKKAAALAARNKRRNKYKSGVRSLSGIKNIPQNVGNNNSDIPQKPIARFNINEFKKAVEEGKLKEYNKEFPLSKKDVFKTDYNGQMVISLVIDNKQLADFAEIMEKTGEPLTRKEFAANDRMSITGFQRAAGKGELDVVQSILEKDNDKITKADFTRQSYRDNGKTMLHWAAEEKNLKQASDILEKNGELFTKEDLFTQDKKGKAVLRTLAWREELPVAVEVLAKNGETLTKDDLLRKDATNESAFHTAGFNGNLDQVVDILKVSGEKLTREEMQHADTWNRTLLHWNTKNKGGLTKVASIMKDGEKPTREDVLKEDNEGKNVISWAACNGTIDELVATMEDGEKLTKADFLSADKKEQTVAHHAVENKNLNQIVDALKGTGESLKKADFLLTDNMGMTIYHWGMQNANIKQISDAERLNGQKTTIEDVLEKADLLGSDRRERIFYDETGDKLKNMYESEFFTMKTLNEFWKGTPAKFKTEQGKNSFRGCQRHLREEATKKLNPLLVKKTASKGR